MTRINLDMDGFGDVLGEIERLKQKYGEASARIVNSGAEYSAILEFGRGPVEADSAQALQFQDEDGNTIYRTEVSGHPPYPFFYPAVREFEANPESFILGNSALDSLDAIESTDDAVEAIANALQSQMRRNANANRTGRSPGTHPEHPVTDTGNLVARIQVIEA